MSVLPPEAADLLWVSSTLHLFRFLSKSLLPLCDDSAPETADIPQRCRSLAPSAFAMENKHQVLSQGRGVFLEWRYEEDKKEEIRVSLRDEHFWGVRLGWKEPFSTGHREGSHLNLTKSQHQPSHSLRKVWTMYPGLVAVELWLFPGTTYLMPALAYATWSSVSPSPTNVLTSFRSIPCVSAHRNL